jgi:TolA-binding protein
MYGTVKTTTFLTAIALIALLLLPCIAKDAKKDEWRIRENLATRLSGEWFKINVLTRELSSVGDIIADMRNIELFPAEVTRCGEDSLVAFDRKLEACEKKYTALKKQTGALTAPLADGIGILREMVVGQPVEDMFSVLDNEDMRRIAEMFAIKHNIDSLWRNIDTLISSLARKMQMKISLREAGAAGFESEFFEILRANLGEQTGRYYGLLDVIKDTLAARGSENQEKQMYQIEVHRIRENLKQRQSDLAAKKLRSLVKRYVKPQYRDELNFILVKAMFSQNAYDSALAAAKEVADTARFGAELQLYRMQSMYALARYDTLWKWGETFRFDKLTGRMRNCALWMVLESGLALNKTDRFGDLAAILDKDSSYARHVMHALACWYVKDTKYDMALSVFDGAVRFKADQPVDRKALRRILLATAQTQYEKGNFEKARTLFFELVNNEDEETFAEALYGISWCYIRLGLYQKAGNSLTKLVNQAPQSPLAVQALLSMGQRNLNRAQYEWEKLTYLTNAENKLNGLKEQILEKMSDSAETGARDKLKRAAGRIQEMLDRFGKEKRVDASGIANLYKEGRRVALLVGTYYATGSFQEIAFSEKREALLHRLDSLLLVVNGANIPSVRGAFTATAKTVGDVKKLVTKSEVFSATAQIDQFRWEREHLDWQKKQTRRAIDACAKKETKAADPATGARFAAVKTALDATMDSLVIAGDDLVERWYARLTKLCESLVTKSLDTADEIYLRYHDAELHYLRENERYSTAYAGFEAAQNNYDSQSALFRDGKLDVMPEKPVEPALVHDSSMAQYKYLLTKYPRNPLDYAVRYSLAWCYNDLGRFDSAVAQMDSITRLFPASQYAPQAWMYIGEYMFDNAKLDRALKAYQAVLTYPESEWFDKALYKLAWAQYRLSNPEKAISSFLALVDLGDKAPLGKSLLEKESIDYIAISFSETDITGERGLDRAANFVKRFGDPAKGTQILHRLAIIYKDQGRFDMAQKTYRTLLKMYPDYKQSPLIESELLTVMEKNSNVDESNIRNEEFFNKYNKNSEWAKAQTDPRAIAKADSLALGHLYDAAVSYHQLALQKSDTLLYTTAAQSYEEFIRNYPKAKQAGECHYNLAEIQFSLGNYQRAAEEYIAVSKRYPESRYKETAAWNAIVASQNMLKKEGTQLR